MVPARPTPRPLLLDEKFAGKKFAVFVLVEPGALDVEQPDAGEAGDPERVNRQPRNRLLVPASGL
jgi:hypothetical protein